MKQCFKNLFTVSPDQGRVSCKSRVVYFRTTVHLFRVQCKQDFSEFFVTRRFIFFGEKTITIKQSFTNMLSVFHRSLTWKKRINRRPDQMRSQTNVDLFRPISSVKPYSSTVEGNYACLFELLVVTESVSLVSDFPCLFTRSIRINIFFFLEWYWSDHELFWTSFHIFHSSDLSLLSPLISYFS